MKESLKIAGAFVGVIVGAGFASGRELLLMFVDFGVWGLLGAVVSAALFTFLGMALAGMGSRLQATSHKDVVYALCGRYLGTFVDLMITFFMFAVTVVMLAGGGVAGAAIRHSGGARQRPGDPDRGRGGVPGRA